MQGLFGLQLALILAIDQKEPFDVLPKVDLLDIVVTEETDRDLQVDQNLPIGNSVSIENQYEVVGDQEDRNDQEKNNFGHRWFGEPC